MEDCDHAIITCSSARAYWPHVGFLYQVPFYSHSLLKLLDYLSIALVQEGPKQLVAYAAWLPWQACHDRLFNKINQSLVQPIQCFLVCLVI